MECSTELINRDKTVVYRVKNKCKKIVQIAVKIEKIKAMDIEVYCDESGLEALSNKDAHLYSHRRYFG